MAEGSAVPLTPSMVRDVQSRIVYIGVLSSLGNVMNLDSLQAGDSIMRVMRPPAPSYGVLSSL